MFVFYAKFGPKDQTEYQYKEVVYFKDRIGVAHDPLTKEYLINMGHVFLGEIKDFSELPSFLESVEKKKVTKQITTPLEKVEPVAPKVDVNSLPNPDPMSERLPNTEAGQKQWWT